ncbi:hypothetical protein [Lysinibacillus piscis]|uniref:Uncharacterized protein n=1 Tax=Lysinibacillus piscis TaxID=2518931 RepID=A0ABQ5NKI3_9BACI|nr:hypothetical protein [Lysinibacillus sp. KH24]GLC88876.1 hypothetical protein LYSBPC_20030 [Lysinibacillus sp. KH24]
MDSIRKAIDTMYSQQTFSAEQQQKTWQKINRPQQNKIIAPVTLAATVLSCLVLAFILFPVMDSTSTAPTVYAEKSGRERDFSVLLRPWMLTGMISAILLIGFMIVAVIKKWWWRVLLCVIVVIAIADNINDRIGYRYYVTTEADMEMALRDGIWPIGRIEGLHFYETMTLQQYRFSYLKTSDYGPIIAILMHDGRGYKIETAQMTSDETLLSAIYIRDIQTLLIPLKEHANVQKLILQNDHERIEQLVDSPLTAIPTTYQSWTIYGVDAQGNETLLYKPERIWTYDG